MDKRRNSGSINVGRKLVRVAVGAVLTSSLLVGMSSAATALPSQPVDYDPVGTPQPAPDLVMEGTIEQYYSWGSPVPGTYVAKVKVKNIGDKTAPATSVFVSIRSDVKSASNSDTFDPVDSAYFSVPSIEPGKSSTAVPYIFFRYPCSIRMTATADGRKSVYETNESNNTRYLSWDSPNPSCQ